MENHKLHRLNVEVARRGKWGGRYCCKYFIKLLYQLPFLGRWWFIAVHMCWFHCSPPSTSQQSPQAPSPQ